MPKSIVHFNTQTINIKPIIHHSLSGATPRVLEAGHSEDVQKGRFEVDGKAFEQDIVQGRITFNIKWSKLTSHRRYEKPSTRIGCQSSDGICIQE
jgi:hypothetical protein